MGVFEPLHPVLAWLIYYALLRFLGWDHDKKTYPWVLGVFGLLMFLIQLYDLVLPITLGYAWELHFWSKQSFGRLYEIYLLLGMLTTIVAGLNLLARYRERPSLFRLQLGLLILYAALGLVTVGLRDLDFTTIVIPGWHTRIIYGGSYYIISGWLVLALVLHWLIDYYRRVGA